MAIDMINAKREIPASVPRQDDTLVPSHALTAQMRLLAGLLAASLALTVALLFWSAHSQDKIAQANARHLAKTALSVQFNSLQKLLIDYTWWDEAYQKSAATFDPDWFDATFADSEYLEDSFGITGSFLIGPDGAILRHMLNSELVENAPRLDTSVYFSGGMDRLVKSARRLIDGKFDAAAGYVRIAGQYYFAAARAVPPHSEELLAKAAVTPANAYIAVFLRPLDAELAQTLAEDFGLQELRLVAVGDPAAKLPLHTAGGEDFGAMSWTIDRPSRYVLGVILPGLLLIIVFIAILGWYVLNNMRRRQAELLQAMRQARMADRSKTEFLANMSHELRTPLNAIIGFSEIMRDETFGPMENKHYKGYSSDINDSGRQLLNIIDDVLELSRAEAGEAVLQESEVALITIVGAIRQLIDMRAREKGIKLEFDIPPDLPAILADSRAVKQILLNLLSNAVKFTPTGGSVNVRAAKKSNGELEISVSDTGCGIPKNQLDMVMRPFHQVEGPLNRSEGGTGLGLPLSASLMTLHGGNMRISSEIDQGTTVYVTFPVERVTGSS